MFSSHLLVLVPNWNWKIGYCLSVEDLAGPMILFLRAEHRSEKQFKIGSVGWTQVTTGGKWTL